MYFFNQFDAKFFALFAGVFNVFVKLHNAIIQNK